MAKIEGLVREKMANRDPDDEDMFDDEFDIKDFDDEET